MTTAGTTARSLTFVLPRQPLTPPAARRHRRRLAAAEPLGEFYRRSAAARRAS